MEFRKPARADLAAFPQVHPCCYVHQADIALLSGRRSQAVALIALAYQAYDQMQSICDEVTDRAWPERNS